MSCFERALLTGCFERGNMEYFKKLFVAPGVMAQEGFSEWERV
jgi:hypothetical protein